jgi:hypothetical protein
LRLREKGNRRYLRLVGVEKKKKKGKLEASSSGAPRGKEAPAWTHLLLFSSPKKNGPNNLNPLTVSKSLVASSSVAVGVVVLSFVLWRERTDSIDERARVSEKRERERRNCCVA